MGEFPTHRNREFRQRRVRSRLLPPPTVYRRDRLSQRLKQGWLALAYQTVGGGSSLLRTRLCRNSLITPDLQGKNTKYQGSHVSALDFAAHFQ